MNSSRTFPCRVAALLILALLPAVAPAAQPDTAARDQERARKLRDLKFGMFICWSFSTFSDKEWTPGIDDIAFFKPTGMDTDQWARVARDAGMNYILFLTKHHDGFCLWDTDTTERKVTRGPLATDVLAAVRRSCDKYGLQLALYFSEGDWTWPDKNNPDMKKAQLKELCTRYGPIAFFWMDHAAGDGGLNHVDTVEWVKRFQPDCFVGFNHGQVAGDLRAGELGRPGTLDDPAAGGPYAEKHGKDYLVAEFTIPILGATPARWFYTNPANDDKCLPADYIYKLYLDGLKHKNIFSLDVGPDRTGRLRPIDVRTLEQVGRLIRQNAPYPATATSSAPSSP